MFSTAPAARVADAVERGQLGNGDLRQKVLRCRYAEIQGIVNQRAGVGTARVYTKSGGDTLSGLALRSVSTGAHHHSLRTVGAQHDHPGQKLCLLVFKRGTQGVPL